MLRRVLVIDDDELSREVLAVVLDGGGYAVEMAASGEDALNQLGNGETAPDVVLTDLQMPGLCGANLARRLREACGASTRLIAMSGSMPAQTDKPAFDAFLLKPFSAEEFTEVLALLDRQIFSPATKERDRAADKGSEDEALDGRIFEGFRVAMGDGPLRELYGVCLSDAARQRTAMQAAEAARDDASFRRSAHTIKGSLGMLGARELESMCARLEESGLAGTYVATLQEFPAAIERLRRMLIARGVELDTEASGRRRSGRGAVDE